MTCLSVRQDLDAFSGADWRVWLAAGALLPFSNRPHVMRAIRNCGLVYAALLRIIVAIRNSNHRRRQMQTATVFMRASGGMFVMALVRPLHHHSLRR